LVGAQLQLKRIEHRLRHSEVVAPGAARLHEDVNEGLALSSPGLRRGGTDRARQGLSRRYDHSCRRMERFMSQVDRQASA
jgi:hypothetical protein